MSTLGRSNFSPQIRFATSSGNLLLSRSSQQKSLGMRRPKLFSVISLPISCWFSPQREIGAAKLLTSLERSRTRPTIMLVAVPGRLAAVLFSVFPSFARSKGAKKTEGSTTQMRAAKNQLEHYASFLFEMFAHQQSAVLLAVSGVYGLLRS